MKGVEKRVAAIKEHLSLTKALEAGAFESVQEISASEYLLLGLLNQGVKRYIGIFGHGTTTLGEALYHYEKGGVISVHNVRSEIEASHIASILKWQYGETAAVFTSIGPGAMQAVAASLVPLSNQLGLYYIFGDETTHDEGFNMQQIPRQEQHLFLKLISHMGGTYTLHTPQAISAALKRGIGYTHNPISPSPFFLLFPMNIQPVHEEFNLDELPRLKEPHPFLQESRDEYNRSVECISQFKRIAVKVGNGALTVPQELICQLVESLGAAFIHGPSSVGVLPYNHPHNMGVGGSKGSISGNYVMEKCELLIVIGARCVCQWDSSGAGWPSVEQVININRDHFDAAHYNRSISLVGDATLIISELLSALQKRGIEKGREPSTWLKECGAKKREWEVFKKERFDSPTLYDEKWGRKILTQPAAIKTVIDFADRNSLVKYFDAGDVQANGFQLTEDRSKGQTFTETGASYMGFAVSALVASGIVENPSGAVAFTGDGSFMMNPQALLDAVHFNAKGIIALFDNRRMAAISSLQMAQFDHDFRTDDSVEVDYVEMANSIKGAKGLFGGYSIEELQSSLEEAHLFDGVSLIHIPVYFGENPLGGLGAFGVWNVGPWCKDVQREKHKIGL